MALTVKINTSQTGEDKLIINYRNFATHLNAKFNREKTGRKTQSRNVITAENAERAEGLCLCPLYSVIRNITFAN